MADVSSLLQQVLDRLGKIERKIGVASSSSDGPERNPLAAAFEAEIVAGPGAALIAAARAIDGNDGEQLAKSFEAQFASALRVLDMAGACKKPAPEELGPLMAPLKEATKILSDLSHPSKGTKDVDISNAARGMEMGASAFSWPFVAGTVDCVTQGFESSGIYVNKALKAARESHKAPLQALCVAYNGALKAMADWCKENAKMGITWNAKGGAAKDFSGAATASASGSASGGATTVTAPVAAPPAPAPASSAGGSPAPNINALFSAISSIDQSSGRTEGLRKVTKDMKSENANKSLPPPVIPKAPASASGGGASKSAGGGFAVKMGAPRTAVEGLRVVTEFHTKESQEGAILIVDQGTLKHEVYIYGCKDVAIDITTKVKGVRIDSCSNLTLMVQGALSGIEVVNSKRMKVQVKERVPSVAIDKTDGFLVGLPFGSRDAVITSSKSSEMNVTFPVSDAPDADWVECPIPEQFVSKITAANKVSSSVSELYSS